MDLKQIASFVKIEHTLFSLPFVFIGALMAGEPTYFEYFWILIAAVGARGLAMGLNRIIDKDIDAVEKDGLVDELVVIVEKHRVAVERREADCRNSNL